MKMEHQSSLHPPPPRPTHTHAKSIDGLIDYISNTCSIVILMTLVHGRTQNFWQTVARTKKALPYGEKRPPTWRKSSPQKRNHHHFIHGEQCSHKENNNPQVDKKAPNKENKAHHMENNI